MATTSPSSTSTPAKPTFQQGDAVQVTPRAATASDVKSGLYYTHFGNLSGKILKVYGEEASVLVDRASMSDEIRERHETGEKAMRQRWLDGLSEEARNRMNAREKDFGLNYAILVSTSDLRPFNGEVTGVVLPLAPAPGAKVSAAEAKKVAKAAANVDPLTGESDVAEADVDAGEPGQGGTDSAIKRVSARELDAQEQAHLAERAQKTAAPAPRKNGV